MHAVTSGYSRLIQPINALGDYIGLLALRLLLAYEFWEAGREKLSGTNWFAEIQNQFPLPFSALPAEFNWWLVTWVEIVAAIALVIGLGTRLAAVALLILTLVAWYVVHAGLGYNVCDNGFKLPLMYCVMLLPLIAMGAGKSSLDYFLASRRQR